MHYLPFKFLPAHRGAITLSEVDTSWGMKNPNWGNSRSQRRISKTKENKPAQLSKSPECVDSRVVAASFNKIHIWFYRKENKWYECSLEGTDEEFDIRITWNQVPVDDVIWLLGTPRLLPGSRGSRVPESFDWFWVGGVGHEACIRVSVARHMLEWLK